MKGIIGGITIGVVIFSIIVGILVCTERIPAGYAGVVYNMNGGVQHETLSQGWKVVSPTKKITKYSIGWEQSYLTKGKQGDSPEDESFEVPTKDGKGLRVDEAFNYRFDEERLAETFTKFKGRSGDQILTSFIKPNMQAWTKEVTPLYYMTEIIGEQRATVNNALTEYLAEKFYPYGIIIDKVSLVDVVVDEETDKAIQAKIKAQQDLEVAKIDKQTATVKAEQEKAVAEINAEKAKIEAQGKADAALIEAEAEAKANKLISDSLTDRLIEKEKIQKWNGEVPQVQGGGSTIIDTRDMTE